MCETGHECSTDTCWRSDAQKCLDDSLINPKGPTKKAFTFFSNDRFASHQCTSRWECRNVLMKIPISAALSGNKKEWYFQTEAEEIVKITPELYTKGYKTVDGGFIYLKEKYKEPITSSGKAKCYGSDEDNIYCAYMSDNKGEITVKVNKDNLIGQSRATIIQITGGIKTIKNGRPITLTISRNGIIEIQDNQNL